MDFPLPMTPDEIVREAEALSTLLHRVYVEEGQDPQVCELSRDVNLLIREIRASQNSEGRVERRGRSFEGMLRDFWRRYDTYRESRARQQFASQTCELASMHARVENLTRELREGEARERLWRRERDYDQRQRPMPATMSFWLLLFLLLFCACLGLGLMLLQLFFSGMNVARAH